MILKRRKKIIMFTMSLILSLGVVCSCFAACKTKKENVDAPYYDPQEGIDVRIIGTHES